MSGSPYELRPLTPPDTIGNLKAKLRAMQAEHAKLLERISVLEGELSLLDERVTRFFRQEEL